MPAVSSARRLRWVVIVLLAIAVGVVWVLRRAPSGPVAGSRASDPPAAAPAAATAMGRTSEASVSQDAAVVATRSDARARRDALREQILRQLAQRPAAAGDGRSPPAGRPSGPSPGGLVNRAGDTHQAVVDQMNRDFMPLARECVEQAQGRTPQLAGVFALDMETIADEQLGAVVDAADPAPTNEIADPQLIECIRESAFSMTLPPPPTGGRMKVMITLRIDADSGSGGSGSGHS
jgi:hypothetical protein